MKSRGKSELVFGPGPEEARISLIAWLMKERIEYKEALVASRDPHTAGTLYGSLTAIDRVVAHLRHSRFE